MKASTLQNRLFGAGVIILLIAGALAYTVNNPPTPVHAQDSTVVQCDTVAVGEGLPYMEPIPLGRDMVLESQEASAIMFLRDMDYQRNQVSDTELQRRIDVLTAELQRLRWHLKVNDDGGS